MKIPALIVNQWLNPEWELIQFDNERTRKKPSSGFYVFSMSAYLLKRLTGIYRRDPDKDPSEDLGIQRRHDPNRSNEILRYIQKGFPLSRIDEKKLVSPDDIASLRMPGWIPTAVIANILGPDDQRGPNNRRVQDDELVKVKSTSESTAEIILPSAIKEQNWKPKIFPIEIIDGQHRLWALEEPKDKKNKWEPAFKKKIEDFEIPVVAFYGLDRTWQAYLFYTINQLPKKIDKSLVFDLYPLLRTQEWLTKFEGPNIYRENRAQDLTILLWSHSESPWKDRILRLGGKEKGKVTQAAFIRALMASFVKRWQGGKKNPIGGLFGSPLKKHETVLGWSREEQAAFLILIWRIFEKSILESKAKWADELLKREESKDRKNLFYGPNSLIPTDQGIRSFMLILNDLVWLANEKEILNLSKWNLEENEDLEEEQVISRALKSLKKDQPDLILFVEKITDLISEFDWRLSSIIPESNPDHQNQAAYRGSGGYRLLRMRLLQTIKGNSKDGNIKELAEEVLSNLDYEEDEV